MASEDFFDEVTRHYTHKLPFVVYRKPDASQINALLQKKASYYIINDFTESGFVFSPFDLKKESVLIPFSKSKMLSYNGSVSVKSKAKRSHNENEGEEAYINLVKKGIKCINESELQKVVLSRKETVSFSETANPIEIFKCLLEKYPSAFVYCWCHPNVGLWLGATPETLLNVKRRQFSTMALAGTQDYQGTLDVNWNKKEKEEQQFVTHYLKDILKPYVESLAFSEVKTIKAGHLLHLKTDISGVLKQGLKGLQKLILAIHPTPAVCGMPKKDAMQFIIDNEHYNREFYTGFLGELNKEIKIEPRSSHRNLENRAYAIKTKTTRLFVNLRCMQFSSGSSPQQDEWEKAILYVGGGITKGSHPETEWNETVNKAKTIKSVLVF